MIYLLAFLMNITTGLLIISNPLLALERFHADALLLGVLGTGPAIIYALGCAGSGFWTERFGYRKMIILACSLLFLAYSSIFLVDRFRLLLFLALVVGLGASFFWPAMIRWLGEEDRVDLLRIRVGNYNIALIGGVMVGPLLGGMLISVDYRYPYLISALLVLVILTIFMISKKPKASGNGSTDSLTDREEVEEKYTPGFIYIGWAANFAAWFAIGGSQALFPQLAKTLPSSINNRMLGVLIALIPLGEIIVFLILRRSGRWHYNYPLLLIFQLAGIAGLLILALNKHLVLFFPAFLGIGFAGGMTYFSSIFYSLHRQKAKGRKSGFHESFLGLGVALGPITGGLAARQWHLRAPYLLAIVVFVASIIVQLIILKKGK
ncbi:MAG: MFS transporter [Candidatus Euphemobacter frigidus]|nr:MFS transporter [Candidatus Euphemobacter frigidus]MDP8275661.1 MFS transporter [Candidatus Euphemobacter frigidus]